MSETWFTSDTHFAHTNVIKHSVRPFASIEEMDAALVANWNSVVRKGDNVFHLGDFAWRDAEKYRDQLAGNIHLIIGNHEKAAEKIKHRFIWVKDVHMVKVGDQRIWLSHYAHRVWPKSHRGAWHLYGHSHSSLADLPNSKSMDVGVDAVARIAADGAMRTHSTEPQCYRPISFGEVSAIMATKTWEAIDHHGEDCGP